MPFLQPGYVKWDGTKYVTDPTVEIVGPPGPAGPQGATGPAGSGGGGSATGLAGDVTGFVGSTIIQKLTGSSGIVTVDANALNFKPTLSNTIIKQADASSVGNALTIQAQNAGGVNQDGGNLIFRAGAKSGSGFDGSLVAYGTLLALGADPTSVSPTNLSFIINNSTTLRGIYVQGDLTNPFSLVMNASLVGNGQDFKIFGQSGLAGNNNGGNLLLKAGDLTGSGTAGNVLIKNPANTATLVKFDSVHGFSTFGGSGSDYVTSIGPMPGFETGNSGIWFLSSAAIAATSANVALYGNGSQTIINVPISGQFIGFLNAGASYIAQLDTTSLRFMQSGLITFDDFLIPNIKQLDKPANSGTGSTFTIQAQNATGTTSTGGDLSLYAGTGTSTGGNLNMRGNAITFADTSGNERMRLSTVAGTQMQFAAADTSVTITQLQATSGSGKILKIQSQAGFGTGNTNGGQLQLYSGVPNGSGTPGLITIQPAGSSANPTIYLDSSTVEIGGGGANVSIVYIEAPTVLLRDNSLNTSCTFTPALASASWTLGVNVLNFIFNQADNTTNSATGTTFAVQAQNATGTTANGGKLTLSSGTGTSLDGSVQLKIGTVTYAELAEVVAGQRVVALARGADLTSTQMPSNTGDGVIYVANAATDPSANPVSGGILYASSGAGKWRGTSGTVTTFGPAEPHCPTCGRDFAHEWQNTASGEHLAVCVPCMLSEMENTGLNTSKFAFIRKGGV